MLKGQVKVQNKILQLNKYVVRVYYMLTIVLSKTEEKDNDPCSQSIFSLMREKNK